MKKRNIRKLNIILLRVTNYFRRVFPNNHYQNMNRVVAAVQLARTAILQPSVSRGFGFGAKKFACKQCALKIDTPEEVAALEGSWGEQKQEKLNK